MAPLVVCKLRVLSGVVFPLVSLRKDPMNALTELGVKAAFVNGEQSNTVLVIYGGARSISGHLCFARIYAWHREMAK